jgi:hypothetical protein
VKANANGTKVASVPKPETQQVAAVPAGTFDDAIPPDAN